MDEDDDDVMCFFLSATYLCIRPKFGVGGGEVIVKLIYGMVH